MEHPLNIRRRSGVIATDRPPTLTCSFSSWLIAQNRQITIHTAEVVGSSPAAPTATELSFSALGPIDHAEWSGSGSLRLSLTIAASCITQNNRYWR
jgi:hypothetical protein